MPWQACHCVYVGCGDFFTILSISIFNDYVGGDFYPGGDFFFGGVYFFGEILDVIADAYYFGKVHPKLVDCS